MVELETDNKDYRCGWLCYKPDWLQGFRTSAWAVGLISCAAFLQCALVNGLLHMMIPTIERRFNLPSLKSGFISGGYDIASLVCLIPVTYIGGRPDSCKPSWIGIGMIVMGIGGLIFSSPHFFTESHISAGETSSSLCNATNSFHENCAVGKEQLSSYMWVFLVGNLLYGAGASPLYTLGVTYIDDSVVKKKAGLYIGLYYTGATLGVSVGYITGGYFQKLQENFLSTDIDTVSVTPNNKTWVGAWWLGFIIFGLLSMIMAFPIMALPARLPNWEQIEQTRVSEALIGHERTKAYTKLREFPSAMGELIKNTSFILLNFAGCCEGIIFSGTGAFIPKIIQVQFHLSPSTASLVMGVITVPSAILGTMVGGGILKKFDLRFVGILKLCIGTTILAMLCSSCFLLTCSRENIVGVNVPYYVDRKEINLNDPCNSMCGCFWKEFMPICGVNNYIYFSPCHAGCRRAHPSSSPDIILYSNCSCIEERWDNGVQATSQQCKISCSLLPLFLILMYLSLFFTFVAMMPALTATLRCVKSDQRSLALGMQWMIVRLLGFIPGPMLFGVILDGTCERWHAPCSDGEGSCIFYNHGSISSSMLLLGYGWKSLEVALFGLSIYFYKKEGEQNAHQQDIDHETPDRQESEDTHEMEENPLNENHKNHEE